MEDYLEGKDILPSGVLLLEEKDGQECRDNTKNCAPCHLPIEGTVLSGVGSGATGVQMCSLWRKEGCSNNVVVR